MAKYVYRRLPYPERNIRLLEIIPGEQDDPIKCIITTHRDDTHVKYCALSYAWGDDTRKLPISLNGEEFLVTPNLEGALRNLRCSTEEEWDSQMPLSPTLLWIDAICIDQTNLEERNQQVRRMKKIYRRARKVIVYLGNYWEPCDDVLDVSIIKWAGITPQKGTLELTMRALKLCNEISPELPIISSSNNWSPENPYAMEYDMEAWAQLSRLLNRPWFERLWIVQELAASRQAVSAVFQCGRIREVWHTLEDAAAKILRPDQAAIPDEIRRILPWIGAHKLAQVAVTKLTDFDQSNILTVLRHTQWARCSDGRDKLYAITALVDATSDIRVDYASPVTSVYRNWAMRRIERTQSLDILSACANSGSTGELPSWVPDLRRPWAQDKNLWNLTHSPAVKKQTGWELKNKRKREDPEQLFTHQHFSFSADRLRLTLDGHFEGHIVSLSSIGDVTMDVQQPSNLTFQLRSIINRWEQWGKVGTSGMMVSYDKAFSETLLRGISDGQADTPSDSMTMTMYQFWKFWNSWDAGHTMVHSYHLTPEKQRNTVRYVEGRVFSMVHGSQMFRIECESSFNLGIVAGNCDVQVGDQIWLLAGGLTPFILRKIDGGHRLISPCYWQNRKYFTRTNDTLPEEETQEVTLI